METVKTQDITFNDLPWKISYTQERCTMCGSCVAACTFSAIEARIERRSMTISTGHQPEPTQRHAAVPVIRQKNTLAMPVLAVECVRKSVPIMPSGQYAMKIPG